MIAPNDYVFGRKATTTSGAIPHLVKWIIKKDGGYWLCACGRRWISGTVISGPIDRAVVCLKCLQAIEWDQYKAKHGSDWHSYRRFLDSYYVDDDDVSRETNEDQDQDGRTPNEQAVH